MGRKLYIALLIATLLAGIAAFFVGELLLESVSGLVPAAISVALYFAIVYVLCFAAIVLCEYLFERLGVLGWREMARGSERNLLLLFAGGLIAVLLLAAGAELLYEMEPKDKPTGPDRYVFAVDNSGSMETNDPNYERLSVVEECIAALDDDRSIGLYLFDQDTYRAIAVGQSTAGEFQMSDDYAFCDGGTDIYTVLHAIADDAAAAGTEENTRVILLTDGVCAVLSIGGIDPGARTETVEAMKDAGITLNAVGFGDVDGDLLRYLTGGTGGQFIRSNDISALLEDTMTLTAEKEPRTLLNERPVEDAANIWLCILRIFAIAVLGAAINTAMLLSTLCRSEATAARIAFVAVKSLLAGLAAELVIQRSALPDMAGRLAMCMLIALMVLLYAQRRARQQQTLWADSGFAPDGSASYSENKRRLGNG